MKQIKRKGKISGMKMACAITETILAVPVMGGAIIVGLLWTPLLVMLALHIVTLILTHKHKSVKGNVLGIIASTVGAIPLVGWILHIITAVFCWIEVFKDKEVA